MPAPWSLLVQGGTLMIVAITLVAVVAGWIRRPVRLRALGGVVGREGRGWLTRDGDHLVFSRRARRYLIPLQPAAGQAVRRVSSGRRNAGPLLTMYVFRGDGHVVHTVGVTGRGGSVKALVTPAPSRPSLAALRQAPRWLAVPALLASLCLPWAAAWATGSSTEAVVVERWQPIDGPTGCKVRWSTEGVVRDGVIRCDDSDRTVGDHVVVRVFEAPYDGDVVEENRAEVATVAAAGLVAVLGVWSSILVTRRRVGSRPIPLRPVVTTVPGLDRSMPHDSRRRAESMTLYDLAVAAQCAEGHQDVEDNDLLRTPLRALRRRYGGRTALAGVLGLGGLAALVMIGTTWMWVQVGFMGLVAFASWSGVPGLRAVRSAVRHPERVPWAPWERAVAHRHLDGSVTLCLFEPEGTAVWTVPVDRVFRPGAPVEIGAPLRRGSVPLVRVSGVLLLTLESPQRIDRTVPGEVRDELLAALLGPKP